MMKLEQEIVTLCERWWGELSHGHSATLRPVAEQYLQLMGWKRIEPVYIEHAACGFVGLGYNNARVVFYFLMPGELEAPSVVAEHGLDFCETTLMLVGEAQLAKLDYVIATDLNRTYLYDASSDALLLSSDSPREFVSDLLPALLHREAVTGALEELRREPGSYVARQLRSWIEDWTREFTREPFGTDAVAHGLMDRILIMRVLYEHTLCEMTGWSFKSHFTNLISSAYEDRANVTKEVLIKLMSELHTVWGFELFRLQPDLERFITKSTCVVSMLQEAALLARLKFTPSSILESFNFGDATEKARVRLVPETNEERSLWISRLRKETIGNSRIEIDVLDEGYRCIPYWFDQLVERLQQLSLEPGFIEHYEHYVGRAPEVKEGDEMDLFSWTEEGVEEGETAVQSIDLLALAAETSFLIWAASERQHRTARIVMHVHLMELYSNGELRFGQFPNLDGCFRDRPALLESDRRWIYSGGTRNETESEWEVI